MDLLETATEDAHEFFRFRWGVFLKVEIIFPFQDFISVFMGFTEPCLGVGGIRLEVRVALPKHP
uniref:Uncharacterized protein n=1 Tax=Nelumbo nucifera TaxID=4432 RepID=A0A822Y9I0_NELNU|nr:TPA_asm: hypothetical protein HUJ06_030668 [Nelumbo nucifera]